MAYNKHKFHTVTNTMLRSWFMCFLTKSSTAHLTLSKLSGFWLFSKKSLQSGKSMTYHSKGDTTIWVFGEHWSLEKTESASRTTRQLGLRQIGQFRDSSDRSWDSSTVVLRWRKFVVWFCRELLSVLVSLPQEAQILRKYVQRLTAKNTESENIEPH